MTTKKSTYYLNAQDCSIYISTIGLPPPGEWVEISESEAKKRIYDGYDACKYCGMLSYCGCEDDDDDYLGDMG